MKPVEIPHHASDARFHTCSEMGSRVQDEGVDAELLAAEHLVG